MGYDPMTHEPRTDLMACLKLLAMTNLRSLLSQSQLDVNAIKLQYLKQLLQSTDAGAPSLVNSISHLPLQGNPILNSLSEVDNQPSFPLGATIPQPLHHPTGTTPLASPTQQLDPQVPFPPTFQMMPFDAEMDQPGAFFQGDNQSENLFQWVFQSESDIVPSLITETTKPFSNLGDVPSGSTLHGGGSGSGSSSPWRLQVFSDDPTIQYSHLSADDNMRPAPAV